MRVKERFVRGIGTHVFYVESLEQKEENKKNSKWIPAGFQVKIKNLKMNPIILQSYPSNEDLTHLIQRYR